MEKILTEENKYKKYILDFDVKSNAKVQNDPDIPYIVENELRRNPNIFIEIKNTDEGDRWIGLTEEQFNTIKRSAKDREIYMIYASIKSQFIENNPKTGDLTGMFLKEIENTDRSSIFQKFASLNAECKIEFIISSKDLENFSFPFEQNMNMYETELFALKSSKSFYSKDGLRKDVVSIENFYNYDDKMILEISNGVYAENETISQFIIKGSFNLIRKKKKTYIECLSNVEIENEIFGKFNLEKSNIYSFNLATVGRDPKLKRNNLFISKRRVYQLIQEGKILNPKFIINNIAKNI